MSGRAAAIEQERNEVVTRFGPWTASNIHLGEGVYTIGPDVYGMLEQRVDRVVQLVRDLSAGPFEELTVLDLGAYEGAFSIELARRGASVVAVEGREEHAEKTRFAAGVLGLDRLEVIQGDVRDVEALGLGSFDVILCLGILYHLEAPDVLRLVRDLAQRCNQFAVIETQVGLRPSTRVADGDREYFGLSYSEDVRQPAASLDNPSSFWPTRPSLLNLLSDAGFSSVLECLMPTIPALAAYHDHVTLLAAPGGSSESLGERLPERLPRSAHPAQGLRYRLLDRLRRRTGGGLGTVFDRRPGSSSPER